MIKGIFDAKIIKNNKKHFKVERKVKVKTLELKKSKPSRAPQARGEASEVSGSLLFIHRTKWIKKFHLPVDKYFPSTFCS